MENQSYPAVRSLREAFPGKAILLGFEWNVPGLERASVGFAAEETDDEGNPLSDDEACGKDQAPTKCNTREKAYADLWFYSNPIFAEITARGDFPTEDLPR